MSVENTKDQDAPTSLSGWQMFCKNRWALAGLVFISLLVLLAIVIPWFMPEELKGATEGSYLRPMEKSVSGKHTHWLGTDLNGQDLLYRMLTGAQVSLGVGIVAACVSLFIGTLYGMVSGYLGGRIDNFMMRFVDILYSIPRILFVMIFISAFDSYFKDFFDGIRVWAALNEVGWLEKGASTLIPYSRILILVIALGLVEWLTMARIVRGQVLVLKEMPFVSASRTMGQPWWKILRLHLWPNLNMIVLTYLTLIIPAVILDESFLSFLGLGIEDPAASWGSLLKDGAQVISPLDSKWWLLLAPAVLMSTSLLALNFIGEGLKEAFDPKKKR